MPDPCPPQPEVDAELIRRRHVRLRLGIPAHFLTLDDRLAVRLVNLSQSGARVLLPKGKTVTEGVLEWLDYDSFGVAVWQEGEETGFEFDRPLPADWMRATRNAAPDAVRDAARDFVEGKAHYGTER